MNNVNDRHECACTDYGQCPHVLDELVDHLTEAILQDWEESDKT